jgi:hypothetical protein
MRWPGYRTTAYHTIERLCIRIRIRTLSIAPSRAAMKEWYNLTPAYQSHRKEQKTKNPVHGQNLNSEPPSAHPVNLIAKQPSRINTIPRFTSAVTPNLATPAHQHSVENAA